MECDIEEVIGEVRSAFEGYEDALVAHDEDRLREYFWRDERVVRFGIRANQYGPEAIDEFRRTMPPLAPRVLHRTQITTFGLDLATVTTEFGRPSEHPNGRQSQTWVRTPDGWKVVSAHVSQMA